VVDAMPREVKWEGDKGSETLRVVPLSQVKGGLFLSSWGGEGKFGKSWKRKYSGSGDEVKVC
jgi:hypothetical protein